MNEKNKLKDEINFKELLKDPIRLFGWVFPYFVIVVVILGIFFVKNLTDISFNEQPVGVADTTLIKKEIPLKKGGVMPAVDLNVVKNPTQDFIAKGKELYGTTCGACHGENGVGDGVAGAALNPKPRNFHDSTGWKNGRNIDQLYKTLQEGIPGSGMTAYEFLPPSDRLAIISYIRTLSKFPDVTDQQISSMDASYKLSAGTNVANQIPVSLAENKLINENMVINEQFFRFQAKFNSSQDDPGAQMLKKYSINLMKVYTVFLRSDGNQNYDKFVTNVVSNPINSGFRPGIVGISKNDWNILYDFIKSAAM